MLQGRLTLHDLRDTESFCNAWLDKINRKTPLGSHYESALAYLISEAWRTSLTYDPNRSTSFERYLRGKLPNILIDWYRTTYRNQRWDTNTRTGRTRTIIERELRESISRPATLDLPPTDEDSDTCQYPAAPDQHQDELEFTLRAIRGDPTADCDPALARHLETRNSNRARDLDLIRQHATHRAA